MKKITGIEEISVAGWLGNYGIGATEQMVNEWAEFLSEYTDAESITINNTNETKIIFRDGFDENEVLDEYGQLWEEFCNK